MSGTRASKALPEHNPEMLEPGHGVGTRDLSTPEDPLGDFWVPFLQAMAIQPYWKADEPE